MNMETLAWAKLKKNLPKRALNSNKGDFGHILVVGGDYGMAGAVRMAAEAALRVGAGLVSVATHAEHVPIVNADRPEIMCHSVRSLEDLEPLLARATVLVVGPGLGKSAWSQELFNVLLACKQPKIIDADGLNLLSEKSLQSEHWVLTPHPGEAARLLNLTVAEIQQNREDSVQKLQNRYGGIAVLKGFGTLVCTAQSEIFICKAGNPGMSTAGMGDVLSGVIGGLAAQKLSLAEAAKTGVLIHSLAADMAAADKGERGLLANDLFPYLRKLVNE